ncbi:MAG TPA: PDDEXK nuclease domain-containing protein [Kofleriaceae bacterium]|jgi:predicted nuclease of restriction endonuclease-like (RecB) superfamily|nr:PDDEXK nuclease domain-containing protein [Kofleriaceae bacterium]
MTASVMSQATMLPAGYAAWIADVKLRIRAAQQRAALAVNKEMLQLYWQIGRDILDRQAVAGWGTGILGRIEADLRAEFPEMRGFSRSNLAYMRAFAEAWPDPDVIVQRFVGQLPWGQNITLLTKLKTREERLRYAARAAEHGWSRPLLTHHIELRTLEREGKAVTNFEQRLPKPQSDLARETLKDPYRFDFLSLGSEAEERELEAALVTHITKFLLELGAGFSFVGRQVHLEVGGRDFYIDLLFYHLRLRCFVVLELKAVEFEPEHTGKLNFYLSAVDEHLRHEHDNPTIGLLLCKTNNRVIAEYALRDVTKPIGVAEYQLVQALPAQLEANLPSIERLQAELTEADLNELEKIHHVAGGDLATTPPTATPRPAPASKRRATKTAKASPSKKVPRSTKPPPSKKAGR